uniref:PLA2c domain-containing protein n=1 Tax=Erpetoichthys calabaricus TaxID=27687 RepID=A0A8C4RLM4_ERPCA
SGLSVPTVAVLGSGGGLRAMISFLGSMSGFLEAGLLDCVTYLCGVIIKSHVYLQEHNQKLSKQQEAVKNGHNPYPVYAAINKEYFDCDKKNKHPEIWFEFTPYECGFPSYGAFVETKMFGSKFEGSEMKEYHPEPSVYLLQGKMSFCLECPFPMALKSKYKVPGMECIPRALSLFAKHVYLNFFLGTQFFHMVAKTAEVLTRWKFGTKFNYLYHQDPKHVGHNPFVSLVDAGLEINTAYPLMLRAERKVDVIISLDFSEGDLFETLVHATDYAKVNCLPFPPVNINNMLPTDCCVYSDPATPTVIHMPLANSANANGKEKLSYVIMYYLKLRLQNVKKSSEAMSL